MAFCQTYASSSHIRHPWFDTVVMKRKHRETVSPEEETLSTKPLLPPPKRLRMSNLETGFAHMSLGSIPGAAPASLDPRIHEMPLPGMSSSSMDADMLTPSSTHLSSTHEPSYIVEEPKAPEVQMKTSSWYEPEPDRIIITDIDSFTQSDEEGEDSLTVNPAFLDHIRNRTLDSTVTARPKPLPSSTSQALILFQPLPLTESDKEAARKREERRQQEASNLDEDAMDVES